MPYPSRRVTGLVYTPSGDVVVSGRVSAHLIPPGAMVEDLSGSGPVKVAAHSEGEITASGIVSFYVTIMNSMNPLDGYYQVRWQTFAPYQDVWWEVWRITGISTLDLPVASIKPVQWGPSLTQPGYQPLVMAEIEGIQGPQGPPGQDGILVALEVNSLPTPTNSLVGRYYRHNRTPNGQPDINYQVLRTGAGTPYFHYLWEANP